MYVHGDKATRIVKDSNKERIKRRTNQESGATSSEPLRSGTWFGSVFSGASARVTEYSVEPTEYRESSEWSEKKREYPKLCVSRLSGTVGGEQRREGGKEEMGDV